MRDIVERLRNASGTFDEYGIHSSLELEAADLIQSLREKTQYWPDNAERDAVIRHQKEEIERLRAENFSLAAWQCEFTDGKTGLVAHEHGGTYCAMAKENERLREALDKIATAKPQQIGDTEFQQGPLSLWQWAQRIARAALNPAKG